MMHVLKSGHRVFVTVRAGDDRAATYDAANSFPGAFASFVRQEAIYNEHGMFWRVTYRLFEEDAEEAA